MHDCDCHSSGYGVKVFHFDVFGLHICKLINISCKFCNALHFETKKPTNRKFNSCLHKGKSKIPGGWPFLQYLPNLMTNINLQIVEI